MRHKISRLLMTLAALFAMAAGAWAQTITVVGNGDGNWLNGQAWNPTSNELTNTDGIYSITFSSVPAGNDYQFKFTDGTWTESYGYDGSVELNTTLTADGNGGNITFSLTETADITISFKYSDKTFMISTSGKVVGDVSDPDVTLSDDANEASFVMPTSDVTVGYELVRDMATGMTVTVGDGTEGVRYRVATDGNAYQPVGMTAAEVAALIGVTDDIENESLTLQEDFYGLIFPLDDEGNPSGEGSLLADFGFTPGQYVVKAVGLGNYTGTTTVLSNTFTLFEGYEVEVPAGEYVTYYSENDALTLDDASAEFADLYTISSVTATEAVLSDIISVAPKETPLLIYNNDAQTQTILLIPVDDSQAQTVSVADEFKGTSVARTFTTEEMAAADHYVLADGHDFVWVKEAGTIAAGKCWLEVAKNSGLPSARHLHITGGATAIGSVSGDTAAPTGTWYDLQGRRVAATTKGLYIRDGRKVVVK